MVGICALNSKSIGADLVFAWPNAEIAVMGSTGAANIIFARKKFKTVKIQKQHEQKKLKNIAKNSRIHMLQQAEEWSMMSLIHAKQGLKLFKP